MSEKKKYEVSINASATVSFALNVQADSVDEAKELFKKQLKRLEVCEIDAEYFTYSILEPPKERHDYDVDDITVIKF